MNPCRGNCDAVVNELNRQTYRLRCMLQLERHGYDTRNLSIRALQYIVVGYQIKKIPDLVALDILALTPLWESKDDSIGAVHS